MKHPFFILFAAIVLISGCLKDSVKEKYTFYRPVYSTRAEVKNNIQSGKPEQIQQPGKIVVKGHFLFLNEIDKGIHVIDILDPVHPADVAFIAIPGCVDLAVNGNYLYADCYTDLVTLDIADPLHVVVKQFNTGVFPHRFYTGFVADTGKVIQAWVRVDTTVSKQFTGSFNGMDDKGTMYMSAMSSAQSSAVSSSGISIAGSLARFALQNNRMYTVSDDDLKIFNISVASAPAFVSTLDLPDGNIETVFPYKSKLFIGARAGMFIYDASVPDMPKKDGKFAHAKSCDPVIADDKFAFVTLSGGSACGGYSNQLDVIDITNLSAPSLIKTYPLTSPKGLSKDGNTILICDGKDGLKLFDATNTAQLTQVKQLGGFDAVDVIALNGVAVTVAKDGLYFINYSNPSNASVISKMLTAKK